MANNTNAQLRENPQLQRQPKTEREWVQFINELQKWVIDIDVRGRLTSDAVMPQALLSNMGTVQTTLPVTSTDAGATATIDVAQHTLRRSSGSVVYDAGTITGLAYNTRYYIYTDDRDFLGGSVTYSATTTKADIVGNLGRYFVSEVRTPAALAADNTGGAGAGFAVLEGDLTTSGLPAASLTSKGIVELATIAETNTGTDATRAVTPDGLQGSALQTAVDLVNNVATAIYTPTNDVTDRSWNANAAVAGTGIDVAAVTGTDVALLSDHDALVGVVQELSDVVATLVTDLQTKNILG